MIKKPVISPKRDAFLKRRIDHPTETLADSAIAAGYKHKDRLTASKIGSNLMKTDVIKMGLAEYNHLFESAIVGTVKDWMDSPKPRQREIATQNAQYAYDHLHGKSTVKVEQQTSVVRISINLTGDGEVEPGEGEEVLDVMPD